jgi:metallo-beta-lactamase class B
MKVQEGGRSYDVVIIGSMGVNPGMRLVNNSNNPTIAEEYTQGFKVLHSLPCDVPLGSHPAMYGMTAKHAKLGSNPNPFIDPQGYKVEVDLVERTFKAVLDEQRKGLQ